MSGTWIFVRAFLRRDRWMILWFVVGTAFLYYVQAPSVDGLYTSQAEFDTAAASMEQNAAFIAMAGPARALNTVGGQVAWQASAFGAVLAALMSMFLIGRHTRVEEETGRDELIRSGAVGRYAPMTAAVVVTSSANLLLGLLVWGSLASYGLPGAGSVSLGLGVAATGLVFTAVALLAAQLTEGARGMYGITGAVIGIAYALRAIGDIGDGTLSWFSPIGWYQAMRAYADERWWPLLIMAVAIGVVLAAAYAVFDRRDIGAGILATRPGPARASRGLHSELGLTWRLHRGSFVGWAIGLFIGGMAFGSIGDDVGALMGDSDFSKDVFGQGGGSIVDGFYASAALMMALIACGYAVSASLRPRAEEDAGRIEALLATSMPRSRWLFGHVIVAVGGSLVVVVLAGAGMGLGYALVADDWSAVGRFTGATLALSAAVLLLGSLARLLYGFVPRLASLAWLGLGFCVVVMFFGPLLHFPDWVNDISPFTHLALVPAEDFRWLPFLVVLVLAEVVSLAGELGFRRRDAH